MKQVGVGVAGLGMGLNHARAFAELLFFFIQQGMIVPGSTYWNAAFGREKTRSQKMKKV